MTRNEANKYLTVVITTLAEVDFSPESILYLGLGVSLEDWAKLRTLLTMSGLMICEYDTCKLTDAGRKMAATINAAMKVTA